MKRKPDKRHRMFVSQVTVHRDDDYEITINADRFGSLEIKQGDGNDRVYLQDDAAVRNLIRGLNYIRKKPS